MAHGFVGSFLSGWVGFVFNFLLKPFMLSQIIFVYSGESSLQTQRPQRILLSKLIEHRMIQHTYNTRLHMNDVFDLVQVFCVPTLRTRFCLQFPFEAVYAFPNNFCV